MPERDDNCLRTLLASEQGVAWRDRLADCFFDAEAREHVFEEVRAGLHALAPGSPAEEQAALEEEALAVLCFEASRLAVAPRHDATAAALPNGEDLADRVINTYPYPIARPYLALTEEEPGAGAFGCLLDTFESLVHFLATVVVSAYQHGGLGSPECNRHLAERFVKGMWATGDLYALLRDTLRLAGDCAGRLPYPELVEHLCGRKGKPTDSARVLESFVTLRNRAWGHGTGRSDAAFAEALPVHRRRLEDELARMPWLASWQLVRPTQVDDTALVSRVDLLTGFRRKRVDFTLQLEERDLDQHGGSVRVEKSLLLVSPDRTRYLPLFPLSLFGVKPNRRDGVYLLQGCQWQRSAQPRRLEKAVYVAYEADLESHAEPANDLAATRLEEFVGRLTADAGAPAAVPAPAAAAPPAEDPDVELPEVRIEQQTHLRAFVGRAEVLREVTEWIDGSAEGGYLLLLGPPGQGKSALMAELARREGEPPRGGCLLHLVKSHVNPLRFVPALIRQAARLARARFGDDAYRGEVADLRNGLVRALERVRDRTGRALLLVDALDELATGDETRAGAQRIDFLPPTLPEGVRVVLTCRPDIPLVQALRARLDRLRERLLPPLAPQDFRLLLEGRLGAAALRALDDSVDFGTVFDRLGGNPLFLRAAVDRIAGEVEQAAAEGRPVRVDVEALPHSHEAFFRDVYQRSIAEKMGTRWSSAEGRHKAQLLKLLCVTRGHLNYDELSGLMAASGTPLSLEECRDRVDEMSAFLLDCGGASFKPWHQGLTDYVLGKVLGEAGVRQTDEVFCRWLRRAGHTRYGLRHRPAHLLAAGLAEEAAALLTDLDFLEAKAQAGQVFDLAADFRAVGVALPPGHPRRRPLRLLEQALRADLHFLDRHPTCLFPCLWNRCWWYDCTQAARYCESPQESPAGPEVSPGDRLCQLLEGWRRQKEERSPGFPWLRALRPPAARLGTAQRAVLQGHEGWVMSAAFSPDGGRIVSGSGDNTVRVWDAERGQQLACFRGHDDWVLSVAFAPDGRRVVSGSRDGSVRVWDAATGAPLACLRGHEGRVNSVAFAPDGRRVASGSDDRTVRVWDPGGGEVACLRGHRAYVQGVCFTPDSTRLISGSWDRTVRVWDASSGAALALPKRHGEGVWGVAVSADGHLVVSASNDHLVRVWNTLGEEPLGCLAGHESHVTSVAISPDGTAIASGAWDKTVRVWDARSGEPRACLRGHDGGVTAVSFSADGRSLVSGSRDQMVRLWDVESGEQQAPFTGHQKAVLSICFSADGRRLATGGRDRTVRLWDAADGVHLTCLRGHEDAVLSVQFSADGRLLVSGALDRTVRVWDAAGGEQQACLRGHESGVTAVGFSADGRRIVSGSWDRTARVWDAASGREQRCSRLHEAAVNCVALSPDGRRVVSGSSDRTVRVWDPEGGEQLRCLAGHAKAVRNVCFSHDGRRIVSRSNDDTIRIWDAESGTCLEVIRGRGDVQAVAREPAGPELRAFTSPLELAVVTRGGQGVAWFSAPLHALTSHPDGRRWAGVLNNHLQLILLEGRYP